MTWLLTYIHFLYSWFGGILQALAIFVFDVLFHAELLKKMDVTLNGALAKSEDIATDSPGEILWDWGSHHVQYVNNNCPICCSDTTLCTTLQCWGWLTLVCVLLAEKQEEEVADALGDDDEEAEDDDDDDDSAAADTPGGFFWNQVHFWMYSLENVNIFSTLL